MFRSISTKLLVAVLAAVALPVAGFAFLIEYRVADKLMLEMVLKTLQGLATDLAQQVDGELVDRRNDVAGWADEPLVWFATQDHLRELESLESGTAGFTTNWGLEQVVAHGDGLPIEESVANASLLRSALTDSFNSFLANRPELALVALIDTEGQLVTCNSTDADGRAMDPALLRRLFTKDWFDEPWFTVTLEEGEAAYNQHVPDWVVGEPEPEDFYIGLASAADGWPRPGAAYGVLYTLIEWRAFQQLVESSVIKAPFESLVAAGQVPSPYAWIWDADGDTILAHRDPALYGTTVSSIGLEQMVVDVQAGKSGQYREYEFRGERKRGAFHHGLEPSEGGFGWIVGVGIDNRDIDAATSDLRTELFQMTLVLLLLGVLLVMVIARRTTAPILALEEHTRRVSDGELGARIEIDSRDEVGRLAEAFNRMTQDLVQQREQLVRAEKDAAWREMARQIAHDIKNPLTPIQLSLDLLDRSRADDSPQREEILDRTTAMMRRQVESLRGIANDFYEFTGGRRANPTEVDLPGILGEVYALHQAWADEIGVELSLEVADAERAVVWMDREKLRRVLTNLVSNALQAMPEGGQLEGRVCFLPGQDAADDDGVELTLRDTGVGLDDEVRAHLFEPYFTTKSEGTGLGLAISRRVVEEAGGGIALVPAQDDGRGGAIARLWLPTPGVRA